jgi:hypothetical protein
VNAAAYSGLDRLVHRLALGSRTVRHIAFDLEAHSFQTPANQDGCERAVFVCGLARSGTTTLLRLLFETGEFQSLTYRDMPFVLMPRLWQRLAQPSYRPAQPVERAHGDSILVDFDSPEGFECVFWRTFSEGNWCTGDALLPHDPAEEVLEKFRGYVSRIALRTGRPGRYLSKNNNNLLRLPAIKRALPDAAILLMYRDPLQTAISSHRQHLRFCQAQTEDRFVRNYMDWLGHHEFGPGHRPFLFDSAPPSVFSPTEPNYWLEYWNRVYRHVLATLTGFHLVGYESFCGSPAEALRSLFGVLGLAADSREHAGKLRLAHTSSIPLFDPVLLEEARSIHGDLMADPRNVWQQE